MTFNLHNSNIALKIFAKIEPFAAYFFVTMYLVRCYV